MEAHSTLRRLGLWRTTQVALWLLLTSTLASSQPAVPASLTRSRFQAQGRNESILDVKKAGRYTLLAGSKQGARIQIVDRMIGPAEADGVTGERDGRLELLLDAGRYKVLVDSPDKGVGEATLEVRPSKELHLPEPPVLVEHQPVRMPLEDSQHRSWWIHVPERRVVYLEAQGRNLADLRLWKEGTWLMDAVPRTRVIEPVKGQPQRASLLVADLEPGYYLASAYGGTALRWAKEAEEHPFSLRFGIPELPANCRVEGTLSSSGFNRYLVPQEANAFILQLAERRAIRLEVSSFALGDVPGTAEASALIDKKSADPECKVHHTSFKAYALVTVVGSPGDTYLFQCFNEQSTYTFRTPTPRDYRISTLHSGYADDVIDATCILVSSQQSNVHTTAHGEDVLHIGGEKGWARRFNLLEENTVFFFVDEPGDYQIRSSGTGAQFRFEPFFVSPPADYKTPAFEESGAVFSLDRGYWVLTINPKAKGILKVALQQKGFLGRLKDWVLGTDPTPPTPAKGSCTLPKVQLNPDHSYTLYLNRQGRVDRGATLQPLPLALEEPIPLTLQPGREESLTVTAEGEGLLKVFTRADATFACFVDGKPWTEGAPIGAGTHAVWIRNDGPKTLLFTLQGIPPTQLAGAPPRFLGEADKKALDLRLPVLAEQAPVFMDLGVREQRTALLSVASPGLYRIETTGLLKTSLTLRSAVRTKLFAAEANGIGRNALLSQYLKEGTYLLTTQTMDESAGHLGLRVKRTEVTTGAPLSLGHEVKAEVPAHQGIVYPFQLTEGGRYTIRTLGQNRFFPCRLEDAEGWPLLEPTAPSDLVQKLRPGSYRFMNLPLDVDTQRLTMVSRVPDQRKVEGKGPHALALNEKIDNRWREGMERARDIYRVTVPADLDVDVKLGNEQMQAFIRKVGSTEPPLAVPPAKGWTGTLEAGDYLVEVECSRINDLVDYSLVVGTEQLGPGLRREIPVPGSVEVRLAKEAVVELYSHGQLDVRAQLLRDGEPVDASDDAYLDWNFRIARRLPAGHYLLQVDPVGGKPGKTTVGMSAPPEVKREPLADGERMVDLGGAITLFPLDLQPNADVLSVQVSGASLYGCILERDGGVVLVSRTGKDIAFDLPVRKGSSYLLRLWSADHQSETARLRIAGTPVALLPTERLAGAAPFARIQLSQGGTFTPDPVKGFTYASSPDQVLVPAENGLAALPAGETLVHWEGKTSGRLARLFLTDASERRVRLLRGTRQEVDVKASTAGPVVIMTRAHTGKAACLALPPGGERPYRSSAYAVNGDDAVTVIPPGTPGRVLLWDPSEEVPLSELSLARHEAQALPAAEVQAFGTRQGMLAARTGRQWTLPSGIKQVDLVLEDGLVAYLASGETVEAVAFAKGSTTRSSFATRASRLILVSLSGQPASYELGVMARIGLPDSITLGAEAPYERVFPQGGTLRLEVGPSAEERILRIIGNQVACTWMDDQGILRSGTTFNLRSGGVATVTYGPGLVKAWLEQRDGEAEGRWGLAQAAPALPMEPNRVEALGGTHREYAFTVSTPSAFLFQAECPAVARLSEDAAKPSLDQVREGYPDTTLSTYLRPGSYRLRLRALRGEALRGNAEFSLTEVFPIEKTFGPERMIRDGESQLFAFTARVKGQYGIGLKAGHEVLNCQLLRADGTELGAGSQQYVELEPGTYLLRVSLPPGFEPVKFTPVVVGLEPPGSGPPEETLREFLSGLGLNP